MVKHIVCFKLNESSQEQKQKAKEILLSMRERVPMIIDMEVGTDFLCSERSYDIFLSVTLENKEALDDYQKDAYHCDVVKTYMHANVSASVAVDFEF